MKTIMLDDSNQWVQVWDNEHVEELEAYGEELWQSPEMDCA
jgi:hypothetical protein